jgi:hypothetical protein
LFHQFARDRHEHCSLDRPYRCSAGFIVDQGYFPKQLAPAYRSDPVLAPLFYDQNFHHTFFDKVRAVSGVTGFENHLATGKYLPVEFIKQHIEPLCDSSSEMHLFFVKQLKRCGRLSHSDAVPLELHINTDLDRPF